jgi:ribosomal-protein-alanine N-acetyltransferase
MAIVETARLLLRPLGPEDLEEHHAVVGSDPQVTWDGKARTLEESRAYLEAHRQHWDEHAFGMWAAIEKTTGDFLGHAGLQTLEDTDDVQVGYYLGQRAWGRGFATEAARAALRYGFEYLGLPHIVAVARPENRASQKVLAKIGMCQAGIECHYGFDVQVWRIDATAYCLDAMPYRVLA